MVAMKRKSGMPPKGMGVPMMGGKHKMPSGMMMPDDEMAEKMGGKPAKKPAKKGAKKK